MFALFARCDKVVGSPIESCNLGLGYRSATDADANAQRWLT
jgi:hypothetical protein